MALDFSKSAQLINQHFTDCLISPSLHKKGKNPLQNVFVLFVILDKANNELQLLYRVCLARPGLELIDREEQPERCLRLQPGLQIEQCHPATEYAFHTHQCALGGHLIGQATDSQRETQILPLS